MLHLKMHDIQIPASKTLYTKRIIDDAACLIIQKVIDPVEIVVVMDMYFAHLPRLRAEIEDPVQSHNT
jgi:hypothetical protein